MASPSVVRLGVIFSVLVFAGINILRTRPLRLLLEYDTTFHNDYQFAPPKGTDFASALEAMEDEEDDDNNDDDISENNGIVKFEPLPKPTIFSDTNRCFDPDDASSYAFRRDTCHCPDPSVGAPQPRKAWQRHFRDVMQQDNNERAVTATAMRNNNRSAKADTDDIMDDEDNTDDDIEVLFLGDSITERMRGTKNMGRANLTSYGTVFAEVFPRGTARGTASSTTSELLWELEHGWLLPIDENDNVNDSDLIIDPKAIVLLIGTNNLGAGCTQNATLAGIWQVVDYIRSVRPTSLLFVHGLLPRWISIDQPTFGRLDHMVRQINQRLQRASLTHHVYRYMDDNVVFRNNMAALMEPDGLHPNAEGYRQWLPRIKQQLLDATATRKKKVSR